MPDMGAGSILSAGASLVGGMMQGDAAEGAADAQSQATAAAIEEQRRQYDTTRRDLSPWRTTGGQAMTTLGRMLGLSGGPNDRYTFEDFQNYNAANNSGRYPSSSIDADARAQFDAYQAGTGWQPDDFKRLGFRELGGGTGGDFGALNQKFTVGDFWADPVTELGFQFGLGEGTKGLERMAAARGGLNSGATLKALTRYGTDYAGTKAGEAYNRFYGDQDRIFNRLSGVAGSGQTAATNTASMGQNTAQTVGGYLSGLGNARGAAAIGGANAFGGALGNIGNYFGQQATLDKILSSRSPYQTPSYNPYAMSNTTW